MGNRLDKYRAKANQTQSVHIMFTLILTKRALRTFQNVYERQILQQ